MGVAIIHVVDEDAQASKDYRCDIKMLLAHMKLLAADLQDVPGHDIKVSTRQKCIRMHAFVLAHSLCPLHYSSSMQQRQALNCPPPGAASHP